MKNKEDIVALVKSVDCPVNVIAGLPDMTLSVAELSEIGVKRISVGSALARTALTAFLRAAQEIKTGGTFDFDKETASFREINEMFES